MVGVVVTFEDGLTFDVELTTRVTGLYGVKPTVEFVDVLELVDNS